MYLQLRKVFTHNLKGFDLDIPLNKLVVITGPSGSGKSSLVFDTIAKLGKQRMLLLENCGTLLFDYSSAPAEITGAFPPVVAFSQGVRDWFPYKNVCEILGFMPILEYLFLEFGELSCPKCGYLNRLSKVHHVLNWIETLPEGEKFYVLAPIKETSLKALNYLLSLGFTRYLIDGREIDLSEEELQKEPQEVFVILDRLIKTGDLRRRILEAISLSFSINRGKVKLKALSGAEEIFNFEAYCLNCEEPLYFGLRKCPQCRGIGYKEKEPCSVCKGLKLSPAVLKSLLLKREIETILRLSLAEFLDLVSVYFPHFLQLQGPIEDLGITALPLDRPVFKMSLGVRKLLELILALTIKMRGVLYIFDEPTLGLDEARRKVLLKFFRGLVDEGNSCIVVEHDPLFIKSADFVIELGPEGGERGGYLLATYEGLKIPETKYEFFQSSEDKPTLQGEPESFYLRRREYRYYMRAINLLKFSLLEDEEGLIRELIQSLESLGLKVFCGEQVSRSVKDRFLIDYLGIWEVWRDVLRETPDARIRGFNKRHFSFHTTEGTCKRCKGKGEREISLQDINFKIPCEECSGKGLNPEILALTYRGYRVREILDFSLKEALELFSQIPKVRDILSLVRDLKVDYLKLSQRLRELSGGELLRVNLVKTLIERKTNQIIVLTHPFQGLSIGELMELKKFLKKITEEGLTIMIREPHPLADKLADWIIYI